MFDRVSTFYKFLFSIIFLYVITSGLTTVKTLDDTLAKVSQIILTISGFR